MTRYVILLLSLLALLAACSPATTTSANDTPTIDLTGTWQTTPIGGDVVSRLVLTDNGGALSGTAYRDGQSLGPVTGRLSGTQVRFTVTTSSGKIVFSGTTRGTVMTGTYEIRKASGAVDDVGTFSLTKRQK